MIVSEVPITSPTLPGPIVAGVAGASAILILTVMVRSRERAAAFVIGATWLRYILSAFHTITYKPLAAGMSINALSSIALLGVGLLTIDLRHLALRILTPIYVMIGIAVLSAVLNGNVGPGLITVVTKHGFLIVMILSVFAALKRSRDGAFMTSLLWAFFPVFVYQAFSVVLGVGKLTETDLTATSYIGGYNHEAAFSVSLATCLTVACFTQKLNGYAKIGIILACIVGIVLANYRTTLVATAPLVLMFFGFSSLSRFTPRDRPFVVSALIVLGALAFGLVSILFSERFQDLTVATSGHVNFFKPPEYYTPEEARLLSGRAAIWSRYIYGWLRGDLLQYVIGFGPESWNGVFPLYAHNSLVNYLYEYGIVGVIGALYLWLTMLTAALRVQHPHRGVVIGAHLSFLVLNMSTMPMWMIEGNMLYGIICGYTIYLLSLNNQSGQTSAAQ